MNSQDSDSPVDNLPEYASLDNYGQAYYLARQDLLNANLEERCQQAGAHLVSSRELTEINLSFLNQEIFITLRPPELEFKSSLGGEVPLTDKILILHYLLGASSRPDTGEWIGFEAVPDGRLYFSNFLARTHRPLLKKFGNQPQLLLETAAQLGGQKDEFGNFSVRIPAFPKIQIVIILWLGDEDLDPEVKIIFDKNITSHLSAEDVVILCNLIAIRLVKLAPK